MKCQADRISFLQNYLNFSKEDTEKVKNWNKKQIEILIPLGEIDLNLLNYKTTKCWQEVYYYGFNELAKGSRIDATFKFQESKYKEIKDF